MTYDQFWNDDCLLVKAYREAEKLRNERRNEELWLQGMYVYEAVLCVSPVLRAFAKKGSRPLPYPTKPYAITKEAVKVQQDDKEKAAFDKGKRIMEQWMGISKDKFARKGV